MAGRKKNPRKEINFDSCKENPEEEEHSKKEAKYKLKFPKRYQKKRR
jgi:hypothetical protein